MVLEPDTFARRPVLEPNATIDDDETYTLAPIYYDAATGQLQGARKTLMDLEKILLRYPNVQVVLTAHANQLGDATTDLFLTVKQAESVAQQLLDKGVRADQLYLRGCGQYFPLANNQNFDGSTNPMAYQINQRIQIALYGSELPDDRLRIIQPNINSVMRNQAATRYQTDLKGLSYKVRLTNAATPLQHPVLKEYKPITTELRPKALTVTYYVGLDKSFADSAYLLQQLKKAGFEEARVMAYIDGLPLSDEDAQLRFTEYPDLSAYLEYLADE